MSPDLVYWVDQSGVAYPLRPAGDLTVAERAQLDLLRQQVQLSASILGAGYLAPAVAQALPNMVRMMLRLLIPDVAEQEIAMFDADEGHDLLGQWWATADAVP